MPKNLKKYKFVNYPLSKATTHEIRLAHWKQIVEQCQARPEGQTAKQWLAENGISDKSYYYWLRKIRKQAYEQSAGNTLPSGQTSFPAVQAQPHPHPRIHKKGTGHRKDISPACLAGAYHRNG